MSNPEVSSPHSDNADFEQFLEWAIATVRSQLTEYFPASVCETTIDRLVGPAKWQHEVDACSEIVARPFWDLVERQGKCWRPIFGMLLLRALHSNPCPYDQLICVCAELVHTGALIIDDIEDSSELRRGAETIHLRYGLDTAISAGNTLYFLPIPVILEHPSLSDKQKFKMLKSFNTLQLQAHLGQCTDIFWSQGSKIPVLDPENLKNWKEKVLQVYSYKTAAAVVGLADCCAIIANADIRLHQSCREYANVLGVAFQIMDDVVNLQNNAQSRKTSGEDIREGKITFLLIESLLRLPSDKAAQLLKIISSKELREAELSSLEASELIAESGAIESASTFAKKSLQEAWLELEDYLPNAHWTDFLSKFHTKLLNTSLEV